VDLTKFHYRKVLPRAARFDQIQFQEILNLPSYFGRNGKATPTGCGPVIYPRLLRMNWRQIDAFDLNSTISRASYVLVLVNDLILRLAAIDQG